MCFRDCYYERFECKEWNLLSISPVPSIESDAVKIFNKSLLCEYMTKYSSFKQSPYKVLKKSFMFISVPQKTLEKWALSTCTKI